MKSIRMVRQRDEHEAPCRDHLILKVDLNIRAKTDRTEIPQCKQYFNEAVVSMMIV